MNRLIDKLVIGDYHYNRLQEMANQDGVTIQEVVKRLIKLGLNHSIDTFLASEEKVKELIQENRRLWKFIESKGLDKELINKGFK